MDTEVSLALKDLRDSIVEEMREGFKGVHARQDITNGRITKAERESDRQDERLKALHRAVYRRRDDDAPDQDSNAEGDTFGRGGDRRVSERDVKMVAAGIGGAGSLILFFWKLLPALIRTVAP